MGHYIALECYEIICTIQAAIHAGHMPNVMAVVECLSSGTTVQQLQQQQAQQAVSGLCYPLAYNQV